MFDNVELFCDWQALNFRQGSKNRSTYGVFRQRLNLKELFTRTTHSFDRLNLLLPCFEVFQKYFGYLPVHISLDKYRMGSQMVGFSMRKWGKIESFHFSN